MKRITKEEPLYVGAAAVYSYDAKLHEQLWRRDPFDPHGSGYNMGLHQFGQLWVPRNLAPIGSKDFRKHGLKERYVCQMNPRPIQEPVLSEMKALVDQKKSFVLKGQTGFGKTILTLMLIAHYGRRALVVVNKTDLLGQWSERAQECLGLTPSQIGFIQGNRCQVHGKKLVFAMLDSLATNDYPKQHFSNFGIVIFDECHHMGADEYSKAFWKLPALIRVGLSATPKRADGRHKVVEAHIGPVEVVAEFLPLVPEVRMLYTGWMVPTKGNGQPISHSPGRIAPIVSAMSQDHERNQRIATEVKALLDQGRRPVCFADQIQSLTVLEESFAATGIHLSSQVGYYTGSIQEPHKPCVLATYGMTAEATDFPEWDTALLITPRSNIQQTIGRVTRMREGKTALVIDFVDQGSGVLDGYAQKRRDYYQRIGATVHTIQ